mmetsp:Transcript_34969/g.67588  ORF Transcript_34969/g.67588 Transcript_34969/m.67588 type:complete len:288 (-) Transcript_34969:116-979(-)
MLPAWLLTTVALASIVARAQEVRVAEYGACFDGSEYRCEMNPGECVNTTFVSIYDLPDGVNCNCLNTPIGSCYAYVQSERVAFCVEEPDDCPAPGTFIREDNTFGVNCTCSSRSNGVPSRYGGCYNGFNLRCSLDPSDCSPLETWIHAYDVVQYRQGYCHANETYIGACYDPSVRVARCVPNDESCPSSFTWIPPYELEFFRITCLAEMGTINPAIPETTSTTNDDGGQKNKLSGGAIAGIVVACLVSTSLVAVAACWYVRKKKLSQAPYGSNDIDVGSTGSKLDDA